MTHPAIDKKFLGYADTPTNYLEEVLGEVKSKVLYSSNSEPETTTSSTKSTNWANLPADFGEAYDVKKIWEAMLLNQAFISFWYKSAMVIVMKRPTPFFVKRRADETFSNSARRQKNNFSNYVVINAQLFQGSSTDYLNVTTQPLPQTEGLVISNNQIVYGVSSPETYYLAWNNSRWTFGKGDPPNSNFAMGGGIPVIVNKLLFGDKNMYQNGVPKELKGKLISTGEPSDEVKEFLLIRSNSGFRDLNKFSKEKRGFPTIGFDETFDLVIIVVKDDKRDKLSLEEIRDRFQYMGIENAIAFDGASSSTMVVNGKDIIRNEFYKDNLIPIGIGFRS